MQIPRDPVHTVLGGESPIVRTQRPGPGANQT